MSDVTAFPPAWLTSRDPARTSPSPDARASGSRPTGAPPRSILVVDDDESIRDMVASVLRSAGYSVRAAADGESALAALEAEPPALILLDMRMPRVDGREFARRVRERGAAPPIVVMSAVRDARAAAAEIGAQAYMAKPFEIDELLSHVARYTEGRAN